MTVIERVQVMPSTPPAPGVWTPWRLVALVGGTLVCALSVRPFVDPDIYWHVRLGHELLSHGDLRSAGSAWSLVAGHGWVTSQWLSEVVLAKTYDVAGWGGIAVLRSLVAVLTAVLMARRLLRGRRTPWGPVVLLGALVITSEYFQERPQLFSLPLLVWLATVVHDELRGRGQPRLPVLLVVTWLWANLHGLWVMVPACFALLVLARLAETRFRRVPWRLAAVAAGTTAVATLTPAGPALLLAPQRIAGAAGRLAEWQPTSLTEPRTAAFGLLVAALVAGWVRSRTAVPVGELVVVAGLVAFAMYARRDVVPATILLAPLLAERLDLALPVRDAVGSARERRMIGAFVSVTLVLGPLLLVARIATTPTLPSTLPIRLITTLAERPGEHRVVDEYDLGGALIQWGGPRTRVAIDGRADYYGTAYINGYVDLLATTGAWRSELARLHPDYALLDGSTPLAGRLRESGWHTIGTEGTYVLLAVSP